MKNRQAVVKTRADFNIDKTVEIKTAVGSSFTEQVDKKQDDWRYFTYQTSEAVNKQQEYNLQVNVAKNNFVVIDQNWGQKQEKKVSLKQQLKVGTSTLEYLALGKQPIEQQTKIQLNPLSQFIYVNGLNLQNKDVEGKLKVKIMLDKQKIMDDLISKMTLQDNLAKDILEKYNKYQILIVFHPKIDDEFLDHLEAILRQIAPKCFYQIKRFKTPGLQVHFLATQSKDLEKIMKQCVLLLQTELFNCTLCL